MLKEMVQENKTKAIFLVQAIIEDNPSIVREKENLYMYSNDKNHYEILTDRKIEGLFYRLIIDNQIIEQWKLNRISEVKKAIKNETSIKEVTFNNYENLLPFKNGILDIETKELLPHSPEHYFSYLIPIDYDPTARDCGHFINFLLKSVNNDKDTFKKICHIGGYLLYPKIQKNLEKIFIFLGEGANGKGVLFEVLRMFFDKQHTSSLDLSTLSQKSFERATIVGSRVNFCTENKSSKIDAEEIKAIVSGEPIVINEKFKDPYDYTPQLKIVMSANDKPYFNDTSDGIKRRLYFVRFPNTFLPKEEYDQIKNPEKKGYMLAENKDVLLSKLKNELPAILNLFLAGIEQLKKNGWKIEETENSRELKEEFLENQDRLATFLTDYYEEDESENPLGISCEDVLVHYREYYRENVDERGAKMSATRIGMKIINLFRIKGKRDTIASGTSVKKITLYPLKRVYAPTQSGEVVEEVDLFSS